MVIMAVLSLYWSSGRKDSENEEAVPKTEVLEQSTPMISCGPSQKIRMMTQKEAECIQCTIGLSKKSESFGTYLTGKETAFKYPDFFLLSKVND